MRVYMVWGGGHLKIRDVCMDLETCFKVHNLVVIQLNNTKLGRMTNFKVVFHTIALFYKCDKIGNSTQSPVQPQSGHIMKSKMAAPGKFKSENGL